MNKNEHQRSKEGERAEVGSATVSERQAINGTSFSVSVPLLRSLVRDIQNGWPMRERGKVLWPV